MYRSGWARRVSGSGAPLLTAKGSETELCMEGGGVSGCLDGLYHTICMSDETARPEEPVTTPVIPRVAILASAWVAWRSGRLGRQWSWQWSKAWCRCRCRGSSCMEIIQISIHARPMRGTQGRCLLPERNVIIDPGLVAEALCCLDNQQLVLGEVWPAGRKRMAEHQAKYRDGFYPRNNVSCFNNPLLGTRD